VPKAHWSRFAVSFGRIGDDDLHRPTPCRDWDVAALSDHLINTISGLGATAGMQSGVSEGGSTDQRIQELTQPILAGWRRRGLADDVAFAGRTLPGHLALNILSLELVVHGWDFAVALPPACIGFTASGNNSLGGVVV